MSLAMESVNELIPVLQSALGPLILISGIGLLLLIMTKCLGRAIDRARLLDARLSVQMTHRGLCKS